MTWEVVVLIAVIWWPIIWAAVAADRTAKYASKPTGLESLFGAKSIKPIKEVDGDD